MGISFDGKHLLYSNGYKRMIIKEASLGDYKVRLIGEGIKNKTMRISKNLNNKLNSSNDDEKVMILIDNYFRYSKVNYVCFDEYLPYQNDHRFLVMRGNRELDLQFFSEKFDGMPQIVTDKYIRDRQRFCDKNSDVSYYEISYGEDVTSYEKEDTPFGSYIKFSLMGHRDKLGDFDEQFLENFLYEKLSSIGEEAKIGKSRICYPGVDNGLYLDTYLMCGNFVVRIADNYGVLKKEIHSVVNDYNSKRTVAKKKQLKLEGF